MTDNAFNTLGADVDVYVRDIDHSDPSNWDLLEEVAEAFESADYVAETNIWFTKFRQSDVAANLTQDNFYAKLIEWRDTTEDGEVFY